MTMSPSFSSAILINNKMLVSLSVEVHSAYHGDYSALLFGLITIFKLLSYCHMDLHVSCISVIRQTDLNKSDRVSSSFFTKFTVP